MLRTLLLAMLACGCKQAADPAAPPGDAGPATHELWARFRDASGLSRGSAVTVAGLRVGEVTGTTIDGKYARVTLRIRSDVEVRSTATVYKKSASLLGAYYLELDPGSERGATPLRPGDRITRVVEGTTPDQLRRRIEDTLPRAGPPQGQ